MKNDRKINLVVLLSKMKEKFLNSNFPSSKQKKMYGDWLESLQPILHFVWMAIHSIEQIFRVVYCTWNLTGVPEFRHRKQNQALDLKNRDVVRQSRMRKPRWWRVRVLREHNWLEIENVKPSDISTNSLTTFEAHLWDISRYRLSKIRRSLSNRQRLKSRLIRIKSTIQI